MIVRVRDSTSCSDQQDWGVCHLYFTEVLLLTSLLVEVEQSERGKTKLKIVERTVLWISKVELVVCTGATTIFRLTFESQLRVRLMVIAFKYQARGRRGPFFLICRCKNYDIVMQWSWQGHCIWHVFINLCLHIRQWQSNMFLLICQLWIWSVGELLSRSPRTVTITTRNLVSATCKIPWVSV